MTREYLTCTFVMHKLPQIDLLSCNLLILFDSILYLIIILRNLRNNASPAHRPSLPSRDILLKGYWTIGWGVGGQPIFIDLSYFPMEFTYLRPYGLPLVYRKVVK